MMRRQIKTGPMKIMMDLIQKSGKCSSELYRKLTAV